MPNQFFEKYGPWALVTGASAGIGEAFAKELAQRGLNLVLCARRKDRLRSLAEELTREHPIETQVAEVDLCGDDAMERLSDAVGNRELGLIVNNAGIGLTGAFVEQDEQKLKNMVELNCVAPTRVARRFLPPLVARKKGGMIIVASGAGFYPMPYFASYGASKAYDLMLAEALWAECKGKGVDVLALCPGLTKTEFFEAGEIPIDPEKHKASTPQEVVAKGLRALGRQPSVQCGRGTLLTNLFVRLMSRKSVASGMEKVMRKALLKEGG